MKTLRTGLFGLLMLVIGLLIASHGAANAYAAAVCSTATPTITPTLPAELPTAAADAGTQDNPVPLNTVAIITTTKDSVEYDFSLSISKITIGPKAVAILKNTNSFNSDPADGYTYMVAYVTGVYTKGPKDKSGTMGAVDFQSLSSGSLSGYAALVPPSPALEFKGFPGAKFKGWVAFNIDATDSSPLIAWNVGYDGSGGVYFATH